MTRLLSLKLLAFVALTILGIRCSEQPTESELNAVNEDYLVFGHFYGECFGEACVEIFKIENKKLYEDTLDIYPTRGNLPHNTQYVQLSNDKYEKVKHITEVLPDELFSEDDIVLGQPDAGDWGGFYLETVRSGRKESWLIDKMTNNIPEYLHAFVDSLNNAIQQLQ